MILLSEIFRNRKGSHVWGEQTICEVHRMIYDILVVNCQDKPDVLFKVIPLLEKVYEMGIKMTQKLVDYKMSLPDWEKHESKEEVERLRKLRVDLENALNFNIRPGMPKAEA